MIVDFSVPLPRNVARAYAEKISKYLPLAEEVRQIYAMNKKQHQEITRQKKVEVLPRPITLEDMSKSKLYGPRK